MTSSKPKLTTQLAGHANQKIPGIPGLEIRAIVPTNENKTILKLVDRHELDCFRLIYFNFQMNSLDDFYADTSAGKFARTMGIEKLREFKSDFEYLSKFIPKLYDIISIRDINKKIPDLLDESQLEMIEKIDENDLKSKLDFCYFLEIENCFPVQMISTADIKIGRQCFWPGATNKKIQRSYSKTTMMQLVHGYKYCAMKCDGEVMSVKSKEHKAFKILRSDKHLSEITGEEELLNARTGPFELLDKLLCLEPENAPMISEKILNNLIEKVGEIVTYFEEMSSRGNSKRLPFSIYSSSILVGYSDSEAVVKIIDLAHVFYDDLGVDNYLEGIRSFKKHVDQWKLKNF